jgi:2-dehydro-3-deoxygalactonokinase
MKILVIDSGTTSSRVRLYDGKQIIGSSSRQVGAKDVAIHGDNSIIKNTLKECITEVLDALSFSIHDIDAILASGMISSNVGLIEIPHLQAPVGLQDIASALVPQTFPEITSLPIYFIRGVKTGFQHGSTLAEKDMMRGEEAEIFGYLNELNEQHQQGEILFMHYGSHHKCILLRQSRIEECRTSITGELMMSIMQNTILKSSLLPIDEVEPDLEWVRKGLQVAEASGFGRALFSVRVTQTMDKTGKQKATSFYLGVLLSLDFSLLKEMLTADTTRLVLYGKSLYPSMFEPLVKERYPELEVVSITEDESDRLSARGAMRIYEQFAVQ